ncbi:5147_t:CDS:10 [Acaulospora morrowiae]|uniref:5147_t:CDS:1 n=1 Tax=Acaulospora morrowiae TaxID=94023 RepID=A0A9N8V0N3_9GLOM|nr:5147_t:CDS:10 [Acaulospora morrowiae]
MTQDSKESLGTLNDYVLLGRSGLRVSPLCLGALTFGEKWGFGVNFEESKEVFDHYFEQGGNFIDTANLYTGGDSERFLGQYIADKRSQVVVATKYTLNPVNPNVKFNANGGGNHRKSLVENLDESLKRLNTGYVDLLYVHLWEYRTPIEEVMRALDDAVRSGKVLYVGISNTPSWVISRANTISEFRGWSRFIALQTRYNLLNRTYETDLQPASAELGIGTVPWGCIAEGFLTGKYTKEYVEKSKKTGENISNRKSLLESFGIEKNWEILEEVKKISKEVNRSPVQVALNWIAQKPGITSPLIGARTKTQLDENIKALEFKLTPEQISRLDYVSEPSIPFPQSFYNFMSDSFIGSNIEVPERFRPVLNLKSSKPMT